MEVATGGGAARGGWSSLIFCKFGFVSRLGHRQNPKNLIPSARLPILVRSNHSLISLIRLFKMIRSLGIPSNYILRGESHARATASCSQTDGRC